MSQFIKEGTSKRTHPKDFVFWGETFMPPDTLLCDWRLEALFILVSGHAAGWWMRIVLVSRLCYCFNVISNSATESNFLSRPNPLDRTNNTLRIGVAFRIAVTGEYLMNSKLGTGLKKAVEIDWQPWLLTSSGISDTSLIPLGIEDRSSRKPELLPWSCRFSNTVFFNCSWFVRDRCAWSLKLTVSQNQQIILFHSIWFAELFTLCCLAKCFFSSRVSSPMVSYVWVPGVAAHDLRRHT